MTTATIAVTYHDRLPAINVKVHAAGLTFWSAEFNALPVAEDGAQEIGRTTAADLIDAAYNIIQQDFWADARLVAQDAGMGEIASDGRSGGWLVFLTDPTYGGDDDAPPEWLAGYRTVAEWSREFIADAPANVALLAVQLAMDELGAAPAARMFAFERTVTA